MELEKESLRVQLVDLILAARAEYLAAGASPLKHWDQIQDRLRAAARTTASGPEWVTAFARGLGLGAPHEQRVLAADGVAKAMERLGADRSLDLIEDEHGYLMALARLRAEERKALRKGQ